MTNLNRDIPPRVLEEAAEWVLRTESGDHDAATEEAFRVWLNESRKHRTAFRRMQNLWSSPALAQAARPRPAERATVFSWSGPRLWGMAAAAACLLLIVSTILPSDAPGVTQYATDIARTMDVVLADGSTVSLNAASILDIAMEEDSREANLSAGEAFFDIAHESDRPFFVTSGSARIRVVGTRFNVNRLSDHSEISVYSGKVALNIEKSGATPLFLTAGQAASVRASQITRLPDFNVPDMVSWREDWIDANDMPLSQMVEYLNRYLETPVRITDPQVADLKVAGRFRLSKAQQTLSMLSTLYDLEIGERGGHLTLRGS